MADLAGRARWLEYHRATGNTAIQLVNWKAGNPDEAAVARRLEAAEKLADVQMQLRLLTVLPFGGRGGDDDGPGEDALRWSLDQPQVLWMTDRHNYKLFQVEIRCKRVSGADTKLLEACGVDPQLVFEALRSNELVSDAVSRPPACACFLTDLPCDRTTKRTSPATWECARTRASS